jgi:hypothetical protein
MKGRIAQPWTPWENERLSNLFHRARKLNIVLAKVQVSFRE